MAMGNKAETGGKEMQDDKGINGGGEGNQWEGAIVARGVEGGGEGLREQKKDLRNGGFVEVKGKKVGCHYDEKEREEEDDEEMV
eukprot:CAMPEP_0201525308 /NCGR_PEP_ID=MMETSP0161_2-20130828/27661_1 /ASSEMBLY_ACC=CAM_ASM_000251 /TAXON_ID=180227 /ORGANISM="Neoparamoeba aestuarina, Strain SoJaBio B1-5/56/2" /LENGTH=83 /DNA_ID=CAMNT_0047925161 /DNA_START=508 /DNA_END=761 /DNA_ORIENTATION=-